MNRSLLITLIYGLVLLGLAALDGDVVALALPLIVALGMGLADAPQAPQLRAVRTVTPDRVAQGQPAEVLIRVTNQGAALHNLELVDVLPQGLELQEGRTRLLAALGQGATAELRYSVRGARGLYAFGELRATARDRLGVFREQALVPAPAQIFVLPNLLRLRQVSIRPRRTRVYAGVIPARQGGPGVEFFGVRGYQPGDRLRQVNARVTARHTEQLFVNEFEQERVADVGLVLDARAKSNVRGPGHSLFEYGVQATAALADTLIAQGNRVGLLVYGNAIEWTFPGYGKVQREKILRSLAAAEPGDRIALETLEAIPARLFPVRSLLILVSPLLPEDRRALAGLRARGYQLLVISPDPVAFEQAALGEGREVGLGARLASVERDLMLRRMRQVGVPIVNWPVETPFQQVAALALGRVPVRP
jgi:uncharacterized protein (DUF58 family)